MLEPPLQRRVLFDVFPVFVQRGRADAVQFAPRERGFQHVAGIHCAFGRPGADEGVQFVDEQDDAAFLLGQVVEHGLHALLELAPVLGARDQRAHVERQQPPVFQSFRHFPVDDALRETFDDGGLADAGFADEYRVVLRAPLQYLDGAANLVVAADHGVELALLGPLGEIDGVLLQGLPVLFGVGVGNGLAAPNLVDGRFDGFPAGAVGGERIREGAAGFEDGQNEQFARYVLIAALLGEPVRHVQGACERIADLHVAGIPAGHGGQPRQHLAELRAQRADIDPGLGKQRSHAAALLIEQRDQHMQRFDELVVVAERQALRLGQRRLQPCCQLVHSHVGTPWRRSRISCLQANRWGYSMVLQVGRAVSGRPVATSYRTMLLYVRDEMTRLIGWRLLPPRLSTNSPEPSGWCYARNPFMRSWRKPNDNPGRAILSTGSSLHNPPIPAAPWSPRTSAFSRTTHTPFGNDRDLSVRPVPACVQKNG